MSTANQYPHLSVIGIEPWGHARPLCAFVSRVVLNRPVHITLFTTPRACARVKTEISRWFGPDDAERQSLIRVIALDNVAKGAGNPKEAFRIEQERYVVALLDAHKQLVAEKPVTCFDTKVEFPALPAPKIVVLDLFIAGQLVHGLHDVGDVKVVPFCPGMASFGYMTFAPIERGGRAYVKAKVLEEAEKTGRSAVDVADDFAHTYTDDIVHMPGFPDMYHWEHDPQESGQMSKGMLGGIWLSLFDAYDACDGLIIASPEPYEPQTVAATKEWFAETSRPVWVVGPLATSANTQEAIANEEAQSEKSADIKKFLDKTLKEHGEHSAIYISFGSKFWPFDTARLEAFVDVLLEKKIPFILSCGSPTAKLSESFTDKVEQSEVGLLSRWSPQQTILVHPALGWFVTHAGQGSVLESVQSGVPMICWPFQADQPANTVNLTANHDVAYELFEVRSGNGLKPLLRTGKAPVGTLDALRAEVHEVLDKAFGDDGAKKRSNIKNLQQKFDSAWDKGGSADIDMTRFLDSLTD
ncbi:hypothetical protein EUX98_g7990 [Antrodiella citrinella]|uniref:UDP-glycosyltransferases domain-containing protein n=1 Tax=Antrodiella citrinella TaxID=2447956 RepID=A0A4S4MCH1_9APHY|nr:hypothetical protein EUX98_g7990 [Antrodiella citrinella]